MHYVHSPLVCIGQLRLIENQVDRPPSVGSGTRRDGLGRRRSLRLRPSTPIRTLRSTLSARGLHNVRRHFSFDAAREPLRRIFSL